MSRKETSCPAKIQTKMQTSTIGPIIKHKREIPDALKRKITVLQKTVNTYEESLETVRIRLKKVYDMKITTESMKIIECQRKMLQSLELSLRKADASAKVSRALLKLEKLAPLEDDMRKLIRSIERAKETKKELDDLYREIKYKKTSHVVEKQTPGVARKVEKVASTLETVAKSPTPAKASKPPPTPKKPTAAPQKSTPAKLTQRTSTDSVVGDDMCDVKKLRACQKKLEEMEAMRKEWQAKAKDLEYEKTILEKKYKELQEISTAEIETLKSELEKKENRIQDLHYELKNDENKRDILMERLTQTHEKKILELEKNAVNNNPSEIAKFKNEAKNVEQLKNLEIEKLKLEFEEKFSAKEKEMEDFKLELQNVQKELINKNEKIQTLTEKLDKEELLRSKEELLRSEEEVKNLEIEKLKLELSGEKVEKNKMLIEQQIGFDKEKESFEYHKKEIGEELLRLQFENSVLEKELEHQKKVQLTVTDENGQLWYRNIHLRERYREVQSKLNNLSIRPPNINSLFYDQKPINYSPTRFSPPVWSPGPPYHQNRY